MKGRTDNQPNIVERTDLWTREAQATYNFNYMFTHKLSQRCLVEGTNHFHPMNYIPQWRYLHLASVATFLCPLADDEKCIMM